MRTALGITCLICALALGCEDSDPGSAGFGGSGGSATGGSGGSAATSSGGTGGSAGLPPTHCTQDDGAEVLRSDFVGILNGYVDATHFYSVHHAGGPNAFDISFFRFALEPGASTEQIAADTGFVFEFELHESDMWWAQRPTQSETWADLSSSNLYRRPKGGGDKQLVISGDVVAIQPAAPGLVVSRKLVTAGGFNGSYELYPWSGGSPTTICAWATLGSLAVNDSWVVNVNFYDVERCPITGGAKETVVELNDVQYGAEADATHVYWRTSGGLARVALAGGAIEPVVPEGELQDYPYSFALDGDDVVYQAESRILRRPKLGGTAVEVVPQQAGGIAFFTLDATHIYWSEGADSYSFSCIKRKPK